MTAPGRAVPPDRARRAPSSATIRMAAADRRKTSSYRVFTGMSPAATLLSQTMASRKKSPAESSTGSHATTKEAAM